MGLDLESVAVLTDIQDIPIFAETEGSFVLEKICQKLFSGLTLDAVWAGLFDDNKQLTISGIIGESAERIKDVVLDILHIPSLNQFTTSLSPIRLATENNDLHQYIFNFCPIWTHTPHMDIHPLVVGNKCIGVLAISAAQSLINEYRDMVQLCAKHASFVFSTLGILANQNRTQSELRMAAAVFDNSQEGIFITDLRGAIISVNKAVTYITGFSQTELIGQNPRLLKSGRHGHDFYEALWNAVKKNGQWKGEIWNKRKNGEVFPEWLSISAIRNEEGLVEKYVGIFIDISKQKEAERQLHHLAYYDKLSDLPNE